MGTAMSLLLASLNESFLHLYKRLYSAVEPPKGVEHYGSIHTVYYLSHLGIQRRMVAVKVFVDIFFMNAPEEEITRIAVW